MVYSRPTRPLGNFDLLHTAVYCAFHLSTLSHLVKIHSLTLFQHSETHFQKKLVSVSKPLPLNWHGKLTFSNKKPRYTCVVCGVARDVCGVVQDVCVVWCQMGGGGARVEGRLYLLD